MQDDLPLISRHPSVNAYILNDIVTARAGICLNGSLTAPAWRNNVASAAGLNASILFQSVAGARASNVAVEDLNADGLPDICLQSFVSPVGGLATAVFYNTPAKPGHFVRNVTAGALRGGHCVFINARHCVTLYYTMFHGYALVGCWPGCRSLVIHTRVWLRFGG